MSQKMLIDASHNEETRVVVLESKKVEDFDFESFKKLQLSGNIYLAKVTRVEPSLQAAFLDYGGNRHGFLAFSEIHPDYYQIPLEERIKATTDTTQKAASNTKSRKVSRGKRSETKAEKLDFDNEVIVTSVELSGDPESLDSELIEKNLTNNETEMPVPVLSISNEEGLNDEPENDETAFKKQHRKFRIQEVIKVRQILLIQIVKEERGNKGAALTTYLSLAGRYCVLMPNTPRGGGISRKITNIADRKKLKEIANSLSVPEGSGLIIRTAGSNRTKLEIKRDYEYLIRQWEQVRDLTLSSIAPTTIYQEGSLIKRAIRDLYSRTIDEVLVEGERGYKEAKDYMKMLMPSHAKNVKKYEHSIPLFTKYQVEDHLAAMFNPIAQLKSGGYIVINVTEALVAVDVNSGRATKETSIEDTALKTNLEAADELARQIKLRDLAGLIVIDFIDMEERKNNISVERRMKDRLKNDRARTQVGRISIFGLLEMSRQRLRPGMIETSTQACSHCHGTGITRSDDSLSLAILRELEDDGIKNIYTTLRLQTPVDIANYILNEKRDRIATIETRYNLSIKIEALNSLISPEYRIERIKSDMLGSNTRNIINYNNQKPQDDGKDKKVEDASILNAEKEEVVNADENQSKRRRRRRRKPKPRPGTNVILTDEVSTATATAPATATAQDQIELNTQLNKVKSTALKTETKNSPLNKSSKRTSKQPENNSQPVKNSKSKKPKIEIEEKKDPNLKPEKKVSKKSLTKSTAKKPLITRGKKDKISDRAKEELASSTKETPIDNSVSTGDGSSPKRKGWWSIPKK